MTKIMTNPTLKPADLQQYVSDQNAQPLTWVQPGQSIFVQGRSIGDMVYIGREPQTPQSNFRTFSINPNLDAKLPSSKNPDPLLDYSMNYTTMPPEQRGQYLDWLANGRSDTSIPPNYAIMYFFGLERRFFVTPPTPHAERRHIINEVKRLRDLYRNPPEPNYLTDLNSYKLNDNLQHFIAKFLDTAFTVAPDPEQDDPFEIHIAGYYSIHLRDTIGRMAESGEPLSADLVLRWFQGHFEYPESVPLRRALPEFRQLFRLNFAQDHPNGIKVRRSKTKIREDYRSASGAFVVNLDPMLREISDLSNNLRTLRTAAPTLHRTAEQLKKYSTTLQRKHQDRNSLTVHNLLPRSIAHLFPCKALTQLKTWADTLTGSNQTVPIEQVLARTAGSEGTPNAPNPLLNKTNLQRATDTMGTISIGMVPDQHRSINPPKAQQPIFLFNSETNNLPTEPTDQYRVAIATVAAAAAVAWADDTVSASEFRMLRSTTDSQLNALENTEQIYLVHNALWLKNHPINITDLRRKLRQIKPEESAKFASSITQAALTTAAADGNANPQEMKVLTDLFKHLNLTHETIFARLHELTSRQNPVTLQPAGPNSIKDRRLPPPAEPEPDAEPDNNQAPVPDHQPKSRSRKSRATRTQKTATEKSQETPAETSWLDQTHIAQVQADTHQVANLLSQIFQDEPDQTQTLETADRPNDPPHRQSNIPNETKPPTGQPKPDPTEPDQPDQPAGKDATEGADDRPHTDRAFPGLERRHAALLHQLMEQPNWPEPEFQAAARALHLMPDGALEIVNDWSYAKFDDPILEQEPGQVRVNQELQQKITAGAN